MRTPSAIEGEGGASSAAVKKANGNMLMLRDQIADLAVENGLTSSVGSLFPTPNTMDGLPAREGDAYELNLRRGNPDGSRREMSGNLREVVIHNLMPTPNTMDHLPARTPEKIAESRARTPGGYANIRETVVNELLPTVTTQDGKNTGGPSQFDRNTKPLNTQVLVDTEWGKFAPAIERWEKELGRKAPAPTKPDGKDGNHRLSSEFTEWMMGLPAGWVTDAGLTRNEELKACGNGVVPQQAALALKSLLEGVEIETKSGQVNLPTPTVSDTFTDGLASSQQTDGSMHSVTLPQAVKMLSRVEVA